VSVTVFRTITDLFYVVHMVLRFWTGYVRDSTGGLGRGEIVSDPRAIAKRYFKSDFWIDFAAVLPIPQVGAISLPAGPHHSFCRARCLHNFAKLVIQVLF
jgi:hypothetical protein